MLLLPAREKTAARSLQGSGLPIPASTPTASPTTFLSISRIFNFSTSLREEHTLLNEDFLPSVLICELPALELWYFVLKS